MNTSILSSLSILSALEIICLISMATQVGIQLPGVYSCSVLEQSWYSSDEEEQLTLDYLGIGFVSPDKAPESIYYFPQQIFMGTTNKPS